LRTKLLLDSHVPADLVEALVHLRSEIEVEHVATWQEGAYLNATDDLLLEACWEDKRTLVSKDRATLPGWIALRVAAGKDHGGVLLYDLERFKAQQIGALAKAIVAAVDFGGDKLINRWITLH